MNEHPRDGRERDKSAPINKLNTLRFLLPSASIGIIL